MLHEQLLERLRLRRARDDGICAIRREVYDDVFDEIIRQVTLEEPARGVLLKRIKDELQQTLQLHHNLTVRAECYTSRKLLDAPAGMHEKKCRIKELQEEAAAIKAEKHAMQEKCKRIEQDIMTERAKRLSTRQEELAYLRRVNHQLTVRLKAETERVSSSVTGMCSEQATTNVDSREAV